MTMTCFFVPLFIGTTELLLIGGVALLLFGGKKLPEMMRGLGQGVKEFKKGMSETQDATPDNGVDDDGSADTTCDAANTERDGAERRDAEA